MKIGLALGSGGARSFCQVGAIKVLEREGINFDIITGSSMGAVVGSIYSVTKNSKVLEEGIIEFASQPVVKKIERTFTRHRKRNFFKRAIDGFKDLMLLLNDSFRKGLVPSSKILTSLYEYFKKDFIFEESQITLGVVAVEYYSGKITIFNRGKIIPAVVASCAIPGFITPVEINNKKYFDGGVGTSVPVIPNYLLGADVIIGIENEPFLSSEEPMNTFEILVQAEKIKNRYSTALEKSLADFIIKVELEGIEWFNFSYVKECIKIGEKIAEKSLKEIEKILTKANPEISLLRKRYMDLIKEYFSTESSV